MLGPVTSRRRVASGVMAGMALFLPLALIWSAGPTASAAGLSGPSSPAPAPPSLGVGGSVPAGSTTVTDGTDGKVAGMAIPNVSQQQSPDEVSRLRSDGLNTVSLFVWWVQQKSTDNTLAPDYKDGITESDTDLELQMQTSERAGMHVILVPIFYCNSCEGGWRGTIDPSNPTAWFASYQTFIDHYADIAQSYGATTFFAGSEMTSMEHYTAQWEAVIAQVRSHFSGQIGYEENWDVLGAAKFLSDVDVIGVSAYFPLDSGKAPALSDLLSDWTNSHGQGYSGKNWVNELAALASSTGRPILFGEVGYMSGDYAGNQPFLNYLSTTNWQLQSDLYQALLETFSDRSWWAGAVWWEWYLTSDTTSDNSRSPRGKTAEVLIQRWYGRGLRPPSPQIPLAQSPAAFSPDDAEAPRASTMGNGPGTASGRGPAAPAAGTASGSSASGPAAGTGASAHGLDPAGSRSSAASAPGEARPGEEGAGPAAAGGTGRTGNHAATSTRRTLAIVAALGLLAVILGITLIGGTPDAPPASGSPPRR
jgi:hypothetical protein